MLSLSDPEPRAEEESKVIEQGVVAKCQICLNYPSKYKCPKCSLPYCSLKCYSNATVDKQHGSCLQLFAKENIDQNLKAKIKSPAKINQMKKILKRNL